MHLIAWLPAHLDDDALARALDQHGIHTYPLSDYCLEHVLPPALLIGFASTPEDQAQARVEALAQALDKMGYLQPTT
ncbi:UNVERIFIED_ORG: DNA-binding transcriptional MocR family regulator [Pseudomonas reinekei]|nr:DNA-binding transcriptional MocR family regulator [Pseudomonas reinekei]